MTEIKADEKLQEVMERTMCNLRFVYEHHGTDGPYEVVQLVNSFSGAFVHPWEEKQGNWLSELKDFSLSEAQDQGWPVLEKDLPSDKDPASYHEMLKWTRHAFAHGNIEFLNQDGQIACIKIWNCEYRRHGQRGPRNWGSVVSVRDMEDFLWFFCDLASGRVPMPVPFDRRIFSHAAD